MAPGLSPSPGPSAQPVTGSWVPSTAATQEPDPGTI